LDVPTVIRDVPREDLVTALSAAMASGGNQEDVATFLLDNLSKRMGDALRDDIQDRGAVSATAGEAAMTEIVNNIRTLEANGEIKLKVPED
jgi:flagellar motor switch protein FliG